MMKTNLNCVHLWNSIRVNNSGTCTSCCLQNLHYKDDFNQDLNIRKHTLEDIINSNTVNQIRKDLSEGKRNIHCKQCWDLEDAGVESKRMIDNKHLENSNTPEIKYLDLNMGTTCNIKCMTCGPENSAQWNKEMWEYSNKSFNGITDPKEYKEFVRTFNTAFEDDSLIWKELKKQKNTLTRIDMYGGEPMLMLKQWKFLEQLIEDDLAKNISLHYNTNGTIWDEEKYNTLKEFKNVSIDFSIDGLEEQFEYMRFPANWNEVRNNMEEISKFNFDLSICHTVSSLNVWYIKEFLDHFNKWNYYLNLVHGPPEYNIQNLSNKIKAYVTEKYKDDERAKQIISFMNNKSSIYNGHDGFLKAFRNKVGFSDKFRGNDYTLTFPEFASMIEY